LLAMWTLSGCGGNVSIPDTPDAAITEAEKKVKVAADAETAKSAKVGELWTDASSTYKAVQDKFKNTDVGYTGAIESASIMSEKKNETYNAWKQLDAYIRSTDMKSAKREEALKLLLELETKQNNVNAKTPYFKVMDTLVRIFGNNKKFSPVLAIAFIAIFVTGILWPLRYKTFKNAKEMQKYAPQIKALNDKYKDNPAELQAKMKEFQLEHGVNPMGGCLPALAQIPVFLLMIQLINNYQFSFRDATFLWITPALGDLSQMWPAPLKGQIGHHLGEQDLILLVLYAGTMFVQMKLSPPPTDPTQAEQQLSLIHI
jgi:YidC/Oxa1 family membrane protein insertase